MKQNRFISGLLGEVSLLHVARSKGKCHPKASAPNILGGRSQETIDKLEASSTQAEMHYAKDVGDQFRHKTAFALFATRRGLSGRKRKIWTRA